MEMANNNLKGLVFDIQRFSIHDGPGIRTLVFMKGCPLRCKWCCNPEGQTSWPEVMYFKSECTHCLRCVNACPTNARIVREDGRLAIIRKLCTNCFKCVDVCPTNALKIVGKYMSVEEVLEEVIKDSIFYRRSGGGLTVGGGEPLMQPTFVKELLKRAKEDYGLHTAIETSAYAESNVVLDVLQYADFIFCDIKHMNPARHKEYTGVSNEIILKNISLIAEKLIPEGHELVIRIPIIPTINDTKENLVETANFVKKLGENVKIEPLPYHELGKSKYKALDREYPLEKLNIKPPSEERIEELKQILISEGVCVI